MRRALCREPLGDLQAVECVHPGEMLRNGARLVRLHAADEVPGEAPLLQCGNLRQPLLQVALAEVLEAAISGRGEQFGGLPLADREECDRVRTPPGRSGGPCQPFAHRAECGGQILRTH